MIKLTRMNDLELKRKRIETVVKVLGLGAVAFFLAPFIVMTIKGLIGLTVAAVISLLVVNVGVPWFAIKLANWRLKALKYEASLNPIETLENQYGQRVEALNGIRDNLKEFFAVVQELASQIKEHEERYPDKPSQFTEKYQKMLALYNQRAIKYKQAQKNLGQFAELIEEKRSDWKVAQAAAKAMKLANVGQDFQDKLMQDTALSSIQDGLNLAFSELEVSLLDEANQPVTPTVTVTVQPAQAAAISPGRKARAAIADKNPLGDFDLEATTTKQYAKA